MSDHRTASRFLGWLIVPAVLLALLPWWRNHGYLRDLYDYGLVIAANGRLDRGELPYVDFTTPIQAGFLGLNWLIERVGGGTYAALARGAALLIVASGVLLTLMLSRRWPWWAALIVGMAVTVASAAQHTILWHNALGVCCLALVSWAAACAPVLRRTTWPWHAIAALGLFFGGINKLNFHLVALAAALGWAVRAGCLRQASWRRVGATAMAAMMVGVVAPVAVETAWTGASVSLWADNVVHLAGGSRLDELKRLLLPAFWLQPVHDYYGPLLLPQGGLLGGLITLFALAGCWPRREGATWLGRTLVVVAVFSAGGAAAALLATNFEIAYVGLGAWLVLITSLWLGFGGKPRGLFVGGLVVPALLLGVTAWISAWSGQRSQFGFSDAPRAEYVPAEAAGAAFAPLAGLRVPPDLMLSLELIDHTLPDPDAQGLRPVFYGAGLEFLDRLYPSLKRRGQPLWSHWGTSYGPTQIDKLAEDLGREQHFESVFILQAFDVWPAPLRAVLERHYIKEMIGPRVRRWTRQDGYRVNLADSMEAISALGGNVDSRMLHLQRQPLAIRRISDGRLVLGTSRPAGHVLLRAPTYRFGGKAIIDRLPGAGTGPLAVEIKVIVHGAIPEEVRWSGRLELAEGEQSATVPFQLDGHGKQLLIWITQPKEQAGRALAGVRELEITHAFEQVAEAPQLRDLRLAEARNDAEHATALLAEVTWRPQQLAVRGGWAAPHGLVLPPGGEFWVHTPDATGVLRGEITCPDGSGPAPAVRVFWYKGGRVQILQQGWLSHERPFEFQAWTAEPGGWIGVSVEPTEGATPAVIRVKSSTMTP